MIAKARGNADKLGFANVKFRLGGCRGRTPSRRLYVGCIAEAMPEVDYLGLLAAVGFRSVRFVEASQIDRPNEALAPRIEAGAIAPFRAPRIALKSVTALGTKPAG
jgi:hypothetical protein